MHTALALLILVLVMVLAFYLLSIKMRRTFRQVVKIFRTYGATEPKKAVNIKGLGLEQPNFLARAFTLRDYKAQALRMLMQENVVRATEDNKLYLSEEALSASRLKSFARID